MSGKPPEAGRKLRSRAYPVISLGEGIEVLRKLNVEIGWGERDRDAIAKALGYAGGGSGIAGRKAASLVHFGLMDVRGGLYSPTDLAKQILDGGAAVPRNLLREAFLSPTLFREIIDGYKSTGRVPRQLALTLSLDHGIQEHVCEEVARIFMESATYAGVLETDGSFRRSHLEETQRRLPRSDALSTEPASEVQPQIDGGRSEAPSAIRVLRFPVTDGKEVIFHFPQGLNEQDLALMRRQIDFLESQVREDRPDQPLRFEFRRGDRKR